MSRILVRSALGTTLVLHGLANAVLPMRAVDAVAPGVWAPANAALWVGAIVGFCAAGLAVMGVRPLRGLATSLAVAAGLCAVVAHVVLRSGDLWIGIVLSLTLPVAVWVWSSVEPIRERPRASRWRIGSDVLGLAFLAWIGAAAGFWPHHRTWGASPHEWQLALPGDRTSRHPEFEIRYGVTIAAAPDNVWPWLAQLGQDRAGFYSYDRLARVFGADIHNVRELRPEWQTRQTGDGRTRFLIRSTISGAKIPAWAAAIDLTAFQLPHFIMQRRMMLTITELAERSV